MSVFCARNYVRGHKASFHAEMRIKEKHVNISKCIQYYCIRRIIIRGVIAKTEKCCKPMKKTIKKWLKKYVKTPK